MRGHQAQNPTLETVYLFSLRRVQRTRNVTWRMALLGAALCVIVMQACGALTPNSWPVAGMACWIFIKSCMGFRNYHVEDALHTLITDARELQKQK